MSTREMWVDRALIGLLTVDGFIVGLLSVAFAFVRIGGVPLPVAGLIGGLVNCGLLWLAAGYTDGRLRYAPLLAWLAAVLVAAMPGPGGDVVLSAAGTQFVPALLLLILGAGLPATLAFSGRLSGAESR